MLNSSGLESQQEQETFLQNVQFETGAHLTSCSSGYWDSFPGDKTRPVSTVEHSPVFSFEVKNGWSCSSGSLIRLRSVDREDAAFGFFYFMLECTCSSIVPVLHSL